MGLEDMVIGSVVGLAAGVAQTQDLPCQVPQSTVAGNGFRGILVLTTVRKLQLGIAVSAAVHVVVLAWLGTSEAEGPGELEVPPANIEIIEITPEPVAAAPMQVAMLDEARAPEPDATNAVEPQRIAAHSHATIETTAPPGTGSGSNHPEPTGHNALMDMRHPDLRIQLPHYDVLDHVPKGTIAVTEPDVTTGELTPAGNGKMKSNQGEFVMTVDRDGAAHIKDEKNFHMGMRVPSGKDVGKGIEGWQKDLESGSKHQEVGLGTQHTIGGDDKPGESGVVGVPLVGGGFDVTDALMRGHGQDPYAAKKLRILDATRDERVQIGNKRRHEVLGRAAQLMQQNLDQAWASVTDPAGRKQALFDLWDETAETGTADLVEAGAAARKLVIGFIRARLPAGSATAYTAAELTALNNKKQSKAKFAPYE